MKKWISSIILIMLLAACHSVPAGGSPTTLKATSTPIASNTPTVTITPSDTPTITPSPTPESSPTPTVPDFYRGFALTPEQFTSIQETDIPAIIAKLRSEPSLLSPNSPASKIEPYGPGDPESGEMIDCNLNGAINCAEAASVSVESRGAARYLVIMEVRNADGSRGYLITYEGTKELLTGAEMYKGLLQNPLGPFNISIITFLSPDNAASNFYSYYDFLMKQDGMADAVATYAKTGIVPPILEKTISASSAAVY